MPSKVLIRNKSGNYIDYTPSGSEGVGELAEELIRPLPAGKGQGYFSTISIRKNLEFGISRCKFDEDYSAKITWSTPTVCFGFCLSGSTLSCNSCHPTPIAMSPGKSYIHFFEDPAFERRTGGRQELQALVIRVAPNYLLDLLNPNQGYDIQPYEDMIKGLGNGSFFSENIITPEMKTALFQVFNNTRNGRAGRIFLESKALELIAFQLEQITSFSGNTRTHLISAKDRDSIHHARELLIRDLQFPPSLDELARQVGMSHTRLNRGFKKIFGNTVFEYLRKERLAYARKLIEENPVDLTRIALESGFCSSSHMSTRFFKEYGIKPSEYRKIFYK